MKSIVCILFLIVSISNHAQQSPCKTIVLPSLSDSIRKVYEQKLAEAKADYEKDTTNADALVWYGRRTAYLGNYMEAIKIFSKGIVLHPQDARFYRHRAHRYITVRCFDKAIEDFTKAASLINGKPDEVEQDGLPNAQNIPTSTLQSNIWYHLGLAHYLKGNFTKAREAYKKCLTVSTNPDMYVAAANWLYITLRKLNRKKEAAALLETINKDMKLIENKTYLDILLMYKRNEDLFDGGRKPNATYDFGLGNYILLRGDKTEAIQIFKMILKGNEWASFGFIAAEVEISRQ